MLPISMMELKKNDSLKNQFILTCKETLWRDSPNLKSKKKKTKTKQNKTNLKNTHKKNKRNTRGVLSKTKDLSISTFLSMKIIAPY